MTWATILVPLDGSPLAEVALPYADGIARAMGAPLRLVAVLDAGADELAGRAPALRTHLERVTQTGTEQYLELTATMPEEILAAADEDQVALIVMATHGRGGVARWRIGSVADKVMRLSSHPTLLVGAPEPPGAPQPRELRRLLVPLDGSVLGQAALPLAVELAQATGATLTLIRAEPWLIEQMVPYNLTAAVPDQEQLDRDVAEAAREYLATVRAVVPAGVGVDTVVVRGPAALHLVEYAEREAVDLVVMSTHGRGGLRRLVLGSTADHMVRAHLPVLLVRADVTASQ
jgi:nucleotide-binding universal stress UspA family protein